MNYVVDKVKGGVKRGYVHFDTPSYLIRNDVIFLTIRYKRAREVPIEYEKSPV